MRAVHNLYLITLITANCLALPGLTSRGQADEPARPAPLASELAGTADEQFGVVLVCDARLASNDPDQSCIHGMQAALESFKSAPATLLKQVGRVTILANQETAHGSACTGGLYVPANLSAGEISAQLLGSGSGCDPAEMQAQLSATRGYRAAKTSTPAPLIAPVGPRPIQPTPPWSGPALASPGTLRVVNVASGLGSIAGNSVVAIYGSGLASATRVALNTYASATESEQYVLHSASATLMSASDQALTARLPALTTNEVPTGGWAELVVYHDDLKQGATMLGRGRFTVESVAPGLVTADGSGLGTPSGTVTYIGANGSSEVHPLSESLQGAAGRKATLTLTATGALPNGCVLDLATTTMNAVTTLGTTTLPIASLNPIQAQPGYEQVVVDVTEWLSSDLSAVNSAQLYLRTQGCSEWTPNEPTIAFTTDSNDVTVALPGTPIATGSTADPFASISAQAPLPPGAEISGEHIDDVAAYADSLAAWQPRAARVRQNILKYSGLSPLPAKNPLNPIFSNVRQRAGYTVENVAFEATPGFFVTGNLFKPLHRTGPFPAVLISHGHPGAGIPGVSWAGYMRTTDQYQILATRLAQMGAVVFIYDMVGFGDSQQLNHADGGNSFHDRTKNNLLELQLWDSLRSLDFILSLQDTRNQPLVDSHRVGVTGHSGGATQALYLSAVAADAQGNPQIAAAVFTTMISAGFTGDDACEDGMPIHKMYNEPSTNNVEIAALMAPRPAAFFSDTSDWTQWFPTHLYEYAKKVWTLFDGTMPGADERALNWQFSGDPETNHDYRYPKRTRAYQVFAAALGLEQITDTGVGMGENKEGVQLEWQPTLHVFNAAFPRPDVAMHHLCRPDEDHRETCFETP